MVYRSFGVSLLEKYMAHHWINIAPETNPENFSDEEDLEIWKWCKHCGCLKLGKELFPTGRPYEKDILVADPASRVACRRIEK